VLLNFLFFGCVFLVALAAQFVLPPPLYSGEWSPNVPSFLLVHGWAFMILGIFVFNLVVSSFIVVSLPGFVFFPLSVGFLGFRGFLWGLLIFASPNWLFLLSLPTLVLEGEAYVLACVGGSMVGVSWIKPAMLYGKDVSFGSEDLSRTGALRQSLKECGKVYVFVLFLLLAAAVVETAMMVYIGSVPDEILQAKSRSFHVSVS
jgi:hypothetical protein